MAWVPPSDRLGPRPDDIGLPRRIQDQPDSRHSSSPDRTSSEWRARSHLNSCESTCRGLPAAAVIARSAALPAPSATALVALAAAGWLDQPFCCYCWPPAKTPERIWPSCCANCADNWFAWVLAWYAA